jgi:hypothetical protein
MAIINAGAPVNSTAARQWVLDFMGDRTLRSRLDKSLAGLSNEELLARFTWEFERLPILHNAPVSALDASTIPQIVANDDTPLNLTLEGGYLQNPCHRFALGEGETLGSVGAYVGFFINRMHMAAEDFPTSAQDVTMREVNNCFLFNANNLRKTSGGNVDIYGAMTYVLNRETMKSRFFYEAMDAGDVEPLFPELDPPVYPGFGTPGHWYHLVQPHVELFNLPFPKSWGPIAGCCNYSLADVFNRWWAPGNIPIPTTGMLKMIPYYETMTAGNAWLPEDLLYGIAPFGDRPARWGPDPSGERQINVWGNAIGDGLVRFLRVGKRPLVWAYDQAGEMLIDPVVGKDVPALQDMIAASDVALFEKHWKDDAGAAATAAAWAKLAAAAPPRLHLSLPSWNTRAACAAQDANASLMVLGTNGDGECVFWEMDASEAEPARWERLIDGSCEPSASPTRAQWSSQQECEASVTFTCVSGPRGARYCEPAAQGATGECATLEACEAVCHTTPPPTPAPLPPLPPGKTGVYLNVSWWENSASCAGAPAGNSRTGTGQCGFVTPGYSGGEPTYISFATTDCSVDTTLRAWPNAGCTGVPTQLPLPAKDYGVCIPLGASSSEWLTCTPASSAAVHPPALSAPSHHGSW